MSQSLLLDTHVLLWLEYQSENISKKALALILNPDNRRFASVVSLWEITIKWKKGTLELPQDPGSFITKACELSDIQLLSIEADHVLMTANLPDIHSDPFDRLLIAQAISEGMVFVSADSTNRDYPVMNAW